MTNLTPVSSLDDVVQHETPQLVLAGAGGPMNLQAQSLLNRTKYLQDLIAADSTALSDYIALIASSAGAGSVGSILPYAGTVARTQAVRNNDSVCLEDFGAIGNGIADDTVAIQAAFDSGAKEVFATSGKTYNFTALTLSANDFHLVIEGGCTLAPQTPTARSITISGNNCTISGPGTIKGIATFDGANVRPTYAVLWVTGNNFFADRFIIDTIPKEGIMFEDASNYRVEGCKFIGRFPFASYNEASTTNHCGIISNIPPSASNATPIGVIIGNHFESCIQGCLMLNYDAVGNNTGITIVGNTFKNCWDHGAYTSRGKGHTIVGNSFLSCRRPIVSDGVGCTVVGNTLFSEESGVSYAEQMISVRESSNSIIANNTIYGVDAAIFVDCIETTTASGNIIFGNILNSTGTVFANAMIRVGVGATLSEYNIVRGNTLNTASLAAADACIQVTMASGFGRGNEVSDNTVIRTNPGHGISINRNGFSVCKNNRVDISGSAGGATSITGISVDNSAFPLISGNDLYYTAGGTNVTATGISTGAGCTVPKVNDNNINFTAALAAYIPLSFAVTTDSKRNLLDPNASMTGFFTWTTGTASFVVSNANVRSTSKIILTQRDSGAAIVMRDKGFYITPATGSFTIFTADGTNTTSASNWDYEIL